MALLLEGKCSSAIRLGRKFKGLESAAIAVMALLLEGKCSGVIRLGRKDYWRGSAVAL